MLVTTGIDIYAVDSRILYCDLAHRQKKRNPTDNKNSWVPNQNTMQKKNVARLKSNAIYKVFKIVSWLQISS